MAEKEIEAINLHVAGATVRHISPFNDLKSYKNDFELTPEFFENWVIPFYLNIGHLDSEWLNKLTSIKHAITDEIILKNLGDFNWRTRQTGAYFSAITNQSQFIDIIGTHLLKSEVCFAGRIYCWVLASFNLEKSVNYLNQYLDYYLTKPELYFNQQNAMEAILYLDKLNSTNHFESHINNWLEFAKNKPYWDIEIMTDNIENQINLIQTVRQFAS